MLSSSKARNPLDLNGSDFSALRCLVQSSANSRDATEVIKKTVVVDHAVVGMRCCVYLRSKLSKFLPDVLAEPACFYFLAILAEARTSVLSHK